MSLIKRLEDWVVELHFNVASFERRITTLKDQLRTASATERAVIEQDLAFLKGRLQRAIDRIEGKKSGS